jgi:hypothetical protein
MSEIMRTHRGRVLKVRNAYVEDTRIIGVVDGARQEFEFTSIVGVQQTRMMMAGGQFVYVLLDNNDMLWC